ncbi:NTP pyrophosphatase, house-cleaning of non-canonical NTPs [Salinibacillus kushneri]|uniref:NTP pyrophosphatase, house-cleaning of non-canonical NTPs n=1 Tax=Salinibacillus kushneri TaxID=237682 RepID=A0A1I0I487_9BACI|nr:nucleotide pyrophosphohydrolase [Salinibacillus kushneri]SET90627.1 NTP pyrophosphatase, house-cleaning of non-canonical NTPs [Salinibacillus kushneri]
MSNIEYTTKEIQKRVDQYISQFKEGYFSPLSLMARLTEETGELAREINHYYGEKPKKKTEEENTVEEELGDLLFVMACFANSLNIDLGKSFDTAMSKFETRDKDRWTKKDIQDGEQNG